jgi:muramoyltetrapeptide carboxypeptidase
MMPISAQPPRLPDVVAPAPLRPGDRIGVIAASGPAEPEMLERGIRFLEQWGFRVRPGCHVYECTGYLAGTDQQRCEDLNDMFADPEIRGILFARGGYGVMRLLETVDYAAAAQDPKILLGMSDVTALSLALYAHAGLMTWAGPMVAGQVASGLDSLSEARFVGALTESPVGVDLLPPDWPVRIVRHGRSVGRFLGGCLSLVTALLGTPFAPDFTDAVLFLEDVNEAPYRLDRMLTHLKLAGVLDGSSAIVLGHFVGDDGQDLSSATESLVRELTADRPVPIIAGFPHGHVLPNVAIPHGAMVELATAPASLRVIGTDSIRPQSTDKR